MEMDIVSPFTFTSCVNSSQRNGRNVKHKLNINFAFSQYLFKNKTTWRQIKFK
jgi:hypothetical protein